MEGLAEATKAGRLRLGKDDEGYFLELVKDTPPVIAGGIPAGGGLTPDEYRDKLARGEEPSEAEIDAMTARLVATSR